MEISNLPDKVLKTLVIKMLNRLRGKIDELSENFNKETENIFKRSELKNTIIEIKNTLEGLNSRLDDAQDWISNLENKVVEITQLEHQKEKKK